MTLLGLFFGQLVNYLIFGLTKPIIQSNFKNATLFRNYSAKTMTKS